MRAQRRELSLAGVLGALASLSAVALLGVSGWLIASAAEMPPVLTLTVAAVSVRFLAISRAVLRYVERLIGHDAAFRGLTGLRVAVYERLERLAPTGLSAFGRGDLLARLVADVDAALDLPLRVVLPWVQAVLVSAATAAFLLWLLPPTGLVIAALAAVAVVVVPWLVALVARRAEARMAPARADLSAAVVRALDATAELTAFGADGRAARTVAGHDDDLTRLNLREAFALGSGGALGVLVQGAAVCAALVVAVPAVIDGRIDPVLLAVVALLPLALFDVLAGLPASALAYQRLRGSALRLREVEDVPPPVPAPSRPLPVPDEFSGLHLRDVTARWVPGRAAITGIDLQVLPGQMVAVVGPSGSGKSTLANVLLGFLPYEGSVRLSGIEIHEADGDDLRTHIGLLAQQAHLFDTTIADNVRIGAPRASDDEVRRALADAQLADWIDTLPKGIETTVGAFGLAVSGGERQRIALARVLLARRSLVILDEPTEHLDGPTADELTVTLQAALRGATQVVITHRLTGLEDADRIVVLQDGRIAAQGTHDELLAAGGWYADQWRLEAERQDMTALIAALPVGRGVPRP
jgi:thiol reductant ABC exporter CydC subunit